MVLHSATSIAPRGDREDIRLSSSQTVLNFHPSDQCAGSVCPVHRPSEHALRELPLAFVGGHMVRLIPGSAVTEEHGVIVPEYSSEPVAVAIDPDDFFFRQSGKAIVRNSGHCPECGDTIVSNFTHDYSSCSCGQAAVDGGNLYLRRTGRVIDSSLVFSAKDGI